MAGAVPNAGEELALKNFLNHTAPQDQVLKLFVNDVTPGATDTAATYTEMSTQGYASKALTGTSRGRRAGAGGGGVEWVGKCCGNYAVRSAVGLCLVTRMILVW